MEENIYYLFMHMVPGIGKKTMAKLLDVFQSSHNVYCAREQELNGVLTPIQLHNFLKQREKKTPQDLERHLAQKGIQYVSVLHPNYPKRLLSIEDRPMGLFIKGELSSENKVTAAVIGTRSNSCYGKSMTREYVKILVSFGIPIISGMARGIDAIAQETAITCGGKTYGVLGCGVDICYPKEHIDLYGQIIGNGGLISEYVPGTPPSPGLFPVRNRIISGLSDIVLVMEAREKSGTLITVDMALEQGKEIFALPGRVNDALSKGCNRLIDQGAGILPPPEQFAKQLELVLGDIKALEISEKKDTIKGGTKMECMILTKLDKQPMTIFELWNEISKENSQNSDESEIRLDIGAITTSLMQLGEKGFVVQNIVGKWERQ